MKTEQFLLKLSSNFFFWGFNSSEVGRQAQGLGKQLEAQFRDGLEFVLPFRLLKMNREE